MATPAWSQTTPEQQAQAVNPSTTTPTTAPKPADEAIIVTATKRASTVQEVPFSVNAQTEEDIRRANASTLEDISRNVASLTVENLGPGQSQVAVRGVASGQIARDQPGVKEQVGVYLDESVISLSLFTPDIDLYDLNRVETLRGPQGTLFGSGSVGGTIRYITNQPKLDRIEGSVEANVNVVEEDDLGYHLKGAVNLPIGPTAALRVVGYGTRYAGFIDAVGPAGGKNVNDGHRIGGRAALLFQPMPELKLTPRIVYQEVLANGFNREDVYNVLGNQNTDPQFILGQRQQYLATRELFTDKTTIADLTASYDFGPVELTSVTSHTNRDVYVGRDATQLTGYYSNAAFGFPNAASNIPSNLVDTTKLKLWTQEVRFASTGSGPFQWVLGGFYSDGRRDYTQTLPTPGIDTYINALLAAGCIADPSTCISPGVPPTTADLANGFALNSPYNAAYSLNSTQKAIFGEASYEFSQFKLTAGGRYYDFQETRQFSNGGIFAPGVNQTDKVKSDGFSPRGIVSWIPNRNLSVNFQVAKGFRLGGVNDPLNTPLCTGSDIDTFGGFQTFKDETLWNYEGGVKYSKGPVTFNASAFYNDIKNLQVTLTAGTCSSRISFNVPKAHSQGIEAELSLRPAPGFDLSVNGSIIDAKFDSTVSTAAGIIPGLREGNRLPTVPQFQMAATAAYTHRLLPSADLLLTASFQHMGDRYTMPDDQEGNPRTVAHPSTINGALGTEVTVIDFTVPAYSLVNLSAGLEFYNGLSLTAYVNNLLDENARLAVDREANGAARLGWLVGQPRTIGLTARYAFSNRTAPPPPIVEAPPPPPPPTQTCADGSVIDVSAVCPAPSPPPPPPPPAPVERGERG
ncbi:MAG: TonB-dependent receptor [Pseudomonadota bacterium]